MRGTENRNWQEEMIGASAGPGPTGPLSLKMIHRIIFRALRAPKTPHQEISSPGPQRANQLGNKNKQFAPET